MLRNFVIMIVFVLFFSACGISNTAESSDDMDILRLNGSKLLSHGPLFIADEEGFFAEQNIKLEYIPLERTNQAYPILETEDMDIILGSLNMPLLNTLLSNENVKVVADRGFVDINSCTYMGLLLRSDLYESKEIEEPEDLEGQQVNFLSGGASEYFMYEYLKQVGLEVGDVEQVVIPRSSVIEAFQSKSIIASFQLEPYIAQINNSGNSVTWVRAEDVIPAYQVGVLIYGSTIIRDNPDLGLRFMKAYMQGVTQYNEGKTDRNLELLSLRTGMSNEDLIAACWPPIRTDGEIQFSAVESFQNWAIEVGYLDMMVTEDQFWTTYYIDAVK